LSGAPNEVVERWASTIEVKDRQDGGVAYAVQTALNGGSELVISVPRRRATRSPSMILAMTTSMSDENQDVHADAGPLDANTLSAR
jgi:hypothetical protein